MQYIDAQFQTEHFAFCLLRKLNGTLKAVKIFTIDLPFQQKHLNW